jgi:hypothetical protein
MDNNIQIRFNDDKIEIKADEFSYSNDGVNEQFNYPNSNSLSAFFAIKNRCKNMYKGLKEIVEYVRDKQC